MKLIFLLFLVALSTIIASAQSDIEKAKERLSELKFNYSTTDDVYRQKIEREVSGQTNMQPKGEFETTKEFQARLAKIDQLRKRVSNKYELEKSNRKAHFLGLIKEIEDAEFLKSAEVTFGPYNADTESLPLTVFVDGERHEELLKLPRAEAKGLKENSTVAKAHAVFGVGVLDGKAIDYYFATTILFGEQRYSTLPKVIPATQTELKALYKNPFVLHIRKTFNSILEGAIPNHVGSEDLTNVDKEYLRSKFFVGLITPALLAVKMY